jgi:hypothetical protein
VYDSLSTRHTSNEIVTDDRVDGVGDTKDRHDDVSEVSCELGLSQSSRRISGSSRLCSEASSVSFIPHGMVGTHERVSPTVSLGK